MTRWIPLALAAAIPLSFIAGTRRARPRPRPIDLLRKQVRRQLRGVGSNIMGAVTTLAQPKATH